MMEFWAEGQGQTPLYSKFGTVPGRNCTHVYHDKHQPTHFQSYLCEQPDQSREPSCWTVPGSRMGGALRDYNNWTEPQLAAPAPQFPFVLDSQPRQFQDTGSYHPPDKREWTTGEAYRAARDREGEIDRRILREGWQRRWEACSPSHYRREASKRSLSDSSYRELEAWAARYSHSLPRRRRIEAELRGASHGAAEPSRVLERDVRSGTEPRMAPRHHASLSANMQELEQWERQNRKQTMSHYTPQTLVSDAAYMTDTMEKRTGYPRRMFSHPPGYIAPPPYDSPHNSSPVMPRGDRYSLGWEQEANRQMHNSQPVQKRQDVLGLQGESRRDDFIKDMWQQRTSSDYEEHSRQKQETANISTVPPQNVENQSDCPSPVQQLAEQSVQETNTNGSKSSSVIEGRKFSFNKKRGGQTIFCLVSRISGTTGLSSSSDEPLNPSPLLHSTPPLQMNIKSTESGDTLTIPEDSGNISTANKCPDEVDLNMPSLKVASDSSVQPCPSKTGRNLKAKMDWMESEQAAAHREELLEVIRRRVKQREDLSHSSKTEKDFAFTEKSNTTNTNPETGRQEVQSLPATSVKYPLWREPGFTGRFRKESLAPFCLKDNSQEAEFEQTPGNRPDVPKVDCQPIDIEVRRLEIKQDTESENSGGFVIIDTTCVIVRVELIPPPKKEQVHYLCSTSHSEYGCPSGDCRLPTESIKSEDGINLYSSPEASTDTPIQEDLWPKNERLEAESNELDQDKIQNATEVTEGEALLETDEVRQNTPTSSPKHSGPERETLEERAERILGIPLLDDGIQHQTLSPFLDPCQQDEEGEAKLTNDQSNSINSQSQDAIIFPELCVDSQGEEEVMSQLQSSETDETVGFLSEHTVTSPVSQKPLQLDKAETGSSIAQGQLTEDNNEVLTDICKQISSTSEENAPDNEPDTQVQQSSEKSEDAAAVTESGVIQDLLSNNYPTDLSEQVYKISFENTIDFQHGIEAKQAAELCENENVTHVTESNVAPDQLSNEEQMSNVAEENVIDCQPKISAKQASELLNKEDNTHVIEINDTFLQLSEEGLRIYLNKDFLNMPEQIPNLSMEKDHDSQPDTDVDQVLELCQLEDGSIIEDNVPEDQKNEDHEDITDLSTQISNVIKENHIDSKAKTDVAQALELKEMDDAHVKEDVAIQDQLSNIDCEVLADLPEQIHNFTTENAVDCQSDPEDNQAFELCKQEDDGSIVEGNVTQDQPSSDDQKDLEDTVDLGEQICGVSMDVIDCQPDSEVQQTLEFRQSEDAACVELNNLTQNQLPNDKSLMLSHDISIISKEKREIEVKLLPTIVNESHLESCKEQEETHEGKNITSDNEVFPELTSISHVPESCSDLHLDPESDALCPSANITLQPLTLTSGTPETTQSVHPESPHTSQLDPSSAPCSSSSQDPTNSVQCQDVSNENILPVSNSSNQDEDLGEAQYPKSLWDAVNRIRKHTAPDSENEEEEVGDLWDRESTEEDFSPLDMEVDVNSEFTIFGSSMRLQAVTSFPLVASSGMEVPVTAGDVLTSQIVPGGHQQELPRRCEDDTLSCCSTNSHGSEDTVVGEDEEEDEQNISDLETAYEVETKKVVEDDNSENCEHCVSGTEELCCVDRLTVDTVVDGKAEEQKSEEEDDKSQTAELPQT